MKLSRREFLKFLGAVGAGAGAVLAGVGGTEAGGTAQVEELSAVTSVTSSCTSSASVTPGSNSSSHELLSEAHPDIGNPLAANITTVAGANIQVCSDITLEIATGYVDTEFDSAHDLGLRVGGHTPASLILRQEDGRLFLYARGDIRLRGITAGYEETVYHYYFSGYEVEEGSEYA